MVLFPHMLIGAVIGSKIANFWAVFVLGIISHFLADAIPHWDYIEDLKNELKNNRLIFALKAGADFLAGAGLIYLAFHSSPLFPFIVAGALAAILPDFWVFVDYFCQVFFKVKNRLLGASYVIHKKIHFPKEKESLKQGLAWESLVVLITAGLILFWR